MKKIPGKESYCAAYKLYIFYLIKIKDFISAILHLYYNHTKRTKYR